MLKLRPTPAASAYRRRICTHSEWNVLMCAPPEAPSVAARCRISSAALLVNVMAQMLYGLTPDSIRQAMRYVMTRVLPLPGPARTRSGPSRWHNGLSLRRRQLL